MERLLAANGDLTAFRTLQNQPAHRGSPPERQLHRFFGAGSGRKIRYGRLLVEALEPAACPNRCEPCSESASAQGRVGVQGRLEAEGSLERTWPGGACVGP